jgi:hypothetical protein
MLSRPIALSLALLGATVFAPSAQAQRTAAGPAGRGGMGASRAGFGARPAYVPRGRRYFAGPGYFPYYDSGFDSGFDYGPAMGAPPQVVYMPAAPPAAPEPPPKPAEAEVIELQGDHWVRLSPNSPPQVVGGSTQRQPAISPSAAAVVQAHPTQAAIPAAAPPSAMLVFRDGHQEAIGKYTIMGTTIYVSTEYWTSGAWTRRVQIAELDVPATLKLNRERGANFRLPSGPEEVMIGP